MRVRCVCLMIIFFGVSALIMGCGEEDIAEPEEEMDEPEDPCIPKVPPNTAIPFDFTPSPGTVISSNQEFTLDFDMVVMEVTVNEVAATATNASGMGRVWIVSLILEPGTGNLVVEWTKPDGCTGAQAMGPYTVIADED